MKKYLQVFISFVVFHLSRKSYFKNIDQYLSVFLHIDKKNDVKKLLETHATSRFYNLSPILNKWNLHGRKLLSDGLYNHYVCYLTVLTFVSDMMCVLSVSFYLHLTYLLDAICTGSLMKMGMFWELMLFGAFLVM